MQGNQQIPFSVLFADTADTHGIVFASNYYAQRGMSAWEVNFWAWSYCEGTRTFRA